MASSHHKKQQQPANMYGVTEAPPPTPSAHPNHAALSTSAAAETLSKLLHRLPPTLSLPTRRSSTTSPPLVSFSDENPNHLLAAASQLGFFQLTNHSIPSQLALSAESESLSFFNLSEDQKESCFRKNWPLGFDAGDGNGESFCIDMSCSTELTELSLTSLSEFACEMKRVGMKMTTSIFSAVGIQDPNPVEVEDPTRICGLIWVSEGLAGAKSEVMGRVYPYVVGLQYQMRCQEYSLLADSGWVSVSPRVESILVTIGDIAQVWSNGKLKKVRGRPVPCLGDKNSRCITMSLLLTPPLDSSISPLVPKLDFGGNKHATDNKDEGEIDENGEEEILFKSFAFEDYAWGVYRERRLLFKDPLDRFRI